MLGLLRCYSDGRSGPSSVRSVRLMTCSLPTLPHMSCVTTAGSSSSCACELLGCLTKRIYVCSVFNLVSFGNHIKSRPMSLIKTLSRCSARCAVRPQRAQTFLFRSGSTRTRSPALGDIQPDKGHEFDARQKQWREQLAESERKRTEEQSMFYQVLLVNGRMLKPDRESNRERIRH